MKQDAESATPPVEPVSGAMPVSPPNTSAFHHSNAPPAVPDHELLKKIGGGSYGEVWLARNVIGTHHAVKIIYRSAFDHDRPFDREFEGIKNAEPISRSLPGLVHILQVGRNDEAGYFYYVMELADDAKPCGEDGRWPIEDSKGSERASRHPPSSILDSQDYAPRTLSSELKRRGALPVEECVQLALALTSALAHLHEHGLVHRDIKPSNIIFVKGEPKLADIGLMADASAAQSFVGTAGFIPPEGPGSPQADLYSLGKVLYEISTGKDRQDFPELPVEMIQAGVAAGILPASEPELPARREEGVAAKRDTTLLNRVTWPLQFFRAAGSRPHRQARMPAATSLLELNCIIIKACETDFRKRYQTAQQMHDDLALLEGGHSIKHKRALEWRFALAKRATLVVAAIALLITLGWLLSTSLNRFNSSTPWATSEITSIAVLPFVNQDSQDPHECLAAMLSDEMRNALTICSGLRVAPRASTMLFKHATNSFREIGEQLGVRTVLAGSMNKTSNQLYVAARLINVADGTELWSATYDRYRRSTNVLEIASQVASNVTQILKLSLPPSALRQMEMNFTRKLAAYRLYSQALSGGANTQEGFDQTVRLLNGAISEDPDFAEAYAELAYCYQDSTGWLLPLSHAMPEAKKNAMRAIELDDALPKAHIALGNVFFAYELNLEKAEAEFRRAIAANPHYAPSYGHYGLFLSWFGQIKKTEDILRKGDEIDPRSHLVHLGWCQHYYLARDTNFYVAANKLLALSTNSVVGLLWQAKAYERSREYSKALEIAERLKQREPTPDILTLLGLIYGRLGQQDKADLLLQELRVLSQGGHRGLAMYDATVLIGLGRNDQAIQELERAVKDYPALVLALKVEPLWDELRQNSRFVELVESVQFK